MLKEKRTILLTLIGIAILLLTVIGSAFAYYSIVNNSEGETNTNFTGVTDELSKYGIPTLNQGVDNIHVNVMVSDMAPTKVNSSYWATDVEEENHKSERQNHIISTASIEGQTTEEETYLQCTSEILITATGSLVDDGVIDTNDGTFYLGSKGTSPSKAKINPTSIPLKTIVDSQAAGGYKTTIEYTIVGNSSVEITADMEIKNTKDDQTALSGKNIDITITNSNLTCSVGEKPGNIELAQENDTNDILSDGLVGGMYRYQGTDNVNNYICLGNDCSENGNDLYRIIGITDDGEIKVIKKTALSTSYKWWSTSKEDVKWPQSLIYQALNGSGDEDSESFYSQIDERVKPYVLKKDWLYGDTTSSGSYDGDTIYGIESGTTEAERRIKNAEDNNYTTEQYTWNETVNAYVGLMYISDYYYAYTNGKPGSAGTAATAWIHLSNNETSHPSGSSGYEWTISRFGYYSSGIYYAWNVNPIGLMHNSTLNPTYALRPSFYLSSEVTLSGEGTLESPYTIF